jgi:ribosomal protein S18 acetylase RimI-like enzyme
MHPLDNPVWESLNSRHASLARSREGAARYPADVAPFVAVPSAEVDAADALVDLVQDGESILFVGPCPNLSGEWRVQAPVPIAQMVRSSPYDNVDDQDIIELSGQHIADMLNLTALVYPHYFRPRTPQMGRYLGIYDGAVLAAMAGERMGFDGYQEISAVCTHPSYTGRGYAQRLVAALSNASFEAGRIPFLHVSHENTRAKSLYERMGYVHRSDVPLRSVRRVVEAGRVG